MSVVAANGINLAYDEVGDAKAPVILLIMGLGTQMIAWPEAFCLAIAQRGFRVVRFDNRDNADFVTGQILAADGGSVYH
jgi:pimeloyl-ACP methyl ester carboxylesterase